MKNTSITEVQLFIPYIRRRMVMQHILEVVLPHWLVEVVRYFHDHVQRDEVNDGVLYLGLVCEVVAIN